jgi:hypothetical protein
MHWDISLGPEKWPIFGRFLMLFPLKCHAQREKNTSNMAATVGDVTCKCSIATVVTKPVNPDSCWKIFEPLQQNQVLVGKM